MKVSSSRAEAAFRSVERACYAGLDSVTLRTEVVRRLAPAVPHTAYSFATTDPDTGLMTHGVGEGIPEQLVELYLGVLYPEEEAIGALDRARAGQTVGTSTSTRFSDVLRSQGLGRELNTVLHSPEGLWGDLCLLRESAAPEFSDPEIRFMWRIAPHVTRGMRAAYTLHAAMIAEAQAETPDPRQASPGVVVLDGRGRIVVRNPAATAQMEDLADVGLPTGPLPYVVHSAARMVHLRPHDATLRARGRSGVWYSLRASRTEPDAAGQSSSIVTIEPVRPREIAPILGRVYGLTPREREIVALTARGESTKSMAARLGLSPYTVQEHLGRACEKVGVRGRRALVARLFYDAYAPEAAGA